MDIIAVSSRRLSCGRRRLQVKLPAILGVQQTNKRDQMMTWIEGRFEENVITTTLEQGMTGPGSHHFDGTTRQTERHRPNAALSSPVHTPVQLPGSHVRFESTPQPVHHP